jgi:hypothetical protein
MSTSPQKALSQMKLTVLASLCLDELRQRRNNETTTDRYCVELLRRAIIEQTDQAWSLVLQCFSETVRGWLRNHPGRDVALLRDSEENLVAQTFSRFWYAMREQQIEFTTLSTALCYLRATLNGILIDTLRSHFRMQLKEVALPECGCPAEAVAEESFDGQDLWRSIEPLLINEREKRIAYLLYFCGLKPREITVRCAKEFNDIKEIYRLNHNIIERLRRNKDRLRHTLRGDV